MSAEQNFGKNFNIPKHNLFAKYRMIISHFYDMCKIDKINHFCQHLSLEKESERLWYKCVCVFMHLLYDV